jgi:hypothetical protein
MKTKLAALTTLCCLATLAISSAAHAQPAVTVTDYKIISDLQPFSIQGVPSNGPSTLQAGANPDAGSYSTFSYSNLTEDIRTALTNFTPGLLGNPTATPRCPEVNLQANTCPADTKIGVSRLDAAPNFTNTPSAGASFSGTVYNAVPLANEPGRLGVVTVIPGIGTLVPSIPFFITPRGAHDYGLTGILSDISRLDITPFGNLHVVGLSFLLNGATNKYVRNPTSCGDHVSTGQAIGWDDPTPVDSPPYTFTTTGCEQVPFNPTMSFQVGARGSTRQFAFPPLNVKITQPAGTQADIRTNVFTLPIELNSNNPAYHLCTQAQVDADACPANSKFGNVTAKSPFLHEPIGGPVYLVEQPGTSLPGLLLDMNGRVHVKVQTSSRFVNGKQIQSFTSDAPQLPISELSIGLNGGRTVGVFQSRSDLCFRSSSHATFRNVMGEYSFGGWNGKTTTTTKVRGSVLGCGPAVKARLSGATGRRPSLRVTATAHPDAPAMKSATLKLRSGMRVSCKRLRRGVGGTASANTPLGRSSFRCVNSRTIRVTLPSAGVRKVSLRLRNRALQVTGSAKRTLHRGHTKRFSVRVTPTPVSGTGTSTSSTFKVKGKKRHR